MIHADEEGHDDDGQLGALHAETADERGGQPVRGAHVGHEDPEHRAEAEDEDEVIDLSADAVDDRTHHRDVVAVTADEGQPLQETDHDGDEDE